MKKYLKYIIPCIVCFCLGHFCGDHQMYFASDCCKNGTTSIPYLHIEKSTTKRLHDEVEYCGAWIALAHKFLYENDPSICSECDSLLDRHSSNYWWDVVSESQEYMDIEELNGGEWEDFYAEW